MNAYKEVMMKKQKKTWLLLGIALVLVIAVLAVLCFKPRALISGAYTISDGISSESDICVTLVSYDGQDVTGQIDHARLVELLSGYSARISLFSSEGIPDLNGAWEINLNHGGTPLYIVVGESGESAFYTKTTRLYRIAQAEALWQELEHLASADVDSEK